MLVVKNTERGSTPRIAFLALAIGALAVPAGLVAQESNGQHETTFTRDIAPILQGHCQRCHREGGVAPMPLTTYEEAQPWAAMMAYKTGLRDKAGAMPPWYVEKDIGIQDFKDDPSLNDEQVATIQRWAYAGAPEGDPRDMPPPLVFNDVNTWTAGEPDLIVKLDELEVGADAPDWWGNISSVPTGLTEDRYVASVEIKEINDVDTKNASRSTVGGRYVVHHMIWSTGVLDETGELAEGERPISWPVHEVGRNPDVFDPDGGRLLKANSSIFSNSIHLHSNGKDSKAHLEVGFRFHPKDYEPKYGSRITRLGNAVDIDIRAGEKDQELHAYTVLNAPTKIVTFEPHLHAPGSRMCLEAIWGYNVETLSCVGYDHNWVRGYVFADHAQPLLPEGTVLHITGYMDNSQDNPMVPDSRNWQGSGNRSVANMFIDLGQRVTLTEKQFMEEMAERREQLNLTKNDHVIGCPLCTVLAVPGG